MKSGTVGLIGRPNTGKSTLINNLLEQKIASASPKPQTTHFPIYAVYEDERGQIIFVDTPGIYKTNKKNEPKDINNDSEKVLSKLDLIVYLIDRTRMFGAEEENALKLIEKSKVPVVLAVNKIDITSENYSDDYDFIYERFDTVIEISALKKWNLKGLISSVFQKLPEGVRRVETANLPFPALNLDARTYIQEIIREKAYAALWDELPYSIRVIVTEITERSQDMTYINATIYTNSLRYKKMIIGKNGSVIKEIGVTSRKELTAATGRKIYLELQVEVG